VPLSLHKRLGDPLRATNLLNAAKNASALKESTTSKCTARQEKQVSNNIHAFPCPSAILKDVGPRKSSPTKVNGGETSTRDGGKGGILGRANLIALSLMHMVQVRKMPFINLRALMQ
jgi:hypothetical protein